jgi:arginyl-tRNA--protein-N-Asp/Glu arginylyltransferase
MESKDILRINLCQMIEDNRPSGCGYCKDPKTNIRKQTSYKYRVIAKSIPIDIWENMISKGWTRCGDLIYKSNYSKTCCKLYQPRVNINNFVISNEQKKIMKRFRKFLSGEYEQNKIKVMEEKKKKEEKFKIDDGFQNRIEEKTKAYINSRLYLYTLRKYLFNGNIIQTICNKVKDTKIRRNNNKKNNFDYSCDFIFIIKTILSPKNKKDKNKNNVNNNNNNSNINNNSGINQINFIEDNNNKNQYKNLVIELYNNFVNYYKPINEIISLNEETGHINFQIKDQEHYKDFLDIEKKIYNNFDNSFKKLTINKNSINNKNEGINNKVKYNLEYFPEIVQEPEIYYPLKHTYTLELTDKIALSPTEERFLLYNKYQRAVHKENSTIQTYNLNWGISNLSKAKKVPIPYNIALKTKHPEIYPKYYGTYNLIHRIDGKIAAVTLWDILPTSLESCYCYYDPDLSFLDLGVVTAIREIEYMKSFQNLIDKNFIYYSMGEMSLSCKKLRYKSNYCPIEIMDNYTGAYVLLTDELKQILEDNKCHLLSNPNNVPLNNFSDIEIEDKFWNLEVNVFGEKILFENFLNLYLEGNDRYKNVLISAVRRFLQIIDKETYSKIEFYYDASVLNQ